jgi:hypothetical protein
MAGNVLQHLSSRAHQGLIKQGRAMVDWRTWAGLLMLLAIAGVVFLFLSTEVRFNAMWDREIVPRLLSWIHSW